MHMNENVKQATFFLCGQKVSIQNGSSGLAGSKQKVFSGLMIMPNVSSPSGIYPHGFRSYSEKQLAT
jgi:hypothetical protein